MPPKPRVGRRHPAGGRGKGRDMGGADAGAGAGEAAAARSKELSLSRASALLETAKLDAAQASARHAQREEAALQKSDRGPALAPVVARSPPASPPPGHTGPPEPPASRRGSSVASSPRHRSVVGGYNTASGAVRPQSARTQAENMESLPWAKGCKALRDVYLCSFLRVRDDRGRFLLRRASKETPLLQPVGVAPFPPSRIRKVLEAAERVRVSPSILPPPPSSSSLRCAPRSRRAGSMLSRRG